MAKEAIEEFAAKKPREDREVLVMRGKDGSAKMVFWNEFRGEKAKGPDEEFKELWHQQKVPDAVDLARQLEAGESQDGRYSIQYTLADIAVFTPCTVGTHLQRDYRPPTSSSPPRRTPASPRDRAGAAQRASVVVAAASAAAGRAPREGRSICRIRICRMWICRRTTSPSDGTIRGPHPPLRALALALSGAVLYHSCHLNCITPISELRRIDCRPKEASTEIVQY